jgi:hypothetical protein
MSPSQARGVWRERVPRGHSSPNIAWSEFGDDHPIGRTGVTELPRLTSDPVCTADRRGGILISFGPQCTTLWDLNPPERFRGP